MNILNLNSSEISELRLKFERMDKNNDGTLSVNEIEETMKLSLSGE